MWMNYTHNTCSATNPPSYYNKDCQQLAQVLENQNQRSSMFRHAVIGKQHEHSSSSGMEAEIVDSNGALITKCYSQSTGSSVGW